MGRRRFANWLLTIGLLAVMAALVGWLVTMPADRASDLRRINRIVRGIRRRFGF